jgi:hypothetical protein
VDAWSQGVNTTKWITVAVLAIWVSSLVVRVLVPATVATFISVDVAVPVVIGYYFSSGAITKRRNGNENGSSK